MQNGAFLVAFLRHCATQRMPPLDTAGCVGTRRV
jgi:hypothetical protein